MHVGALLALTIVYHALMLMLGHPGTTGVWGPSQIILALVVIYPSWVVSVKRAHDLGKSGWWLFGWSIATIPAIVLIVIGFAMSAAGSPGTAIALFAAAVALSLASIWQLLVKLFFFSGQPGNNQFGPPPQMTKALLGDDESTASDSPSVAITAQPRVRVAVPTVPSPKSHTPTSGSNLRRAAAPARPQGFGRRGATPA